MFTTSCSDNRETVGGKLNTEKEAQKTAQNKINQEGIKDSELDKLVKNFVFPLMSTDNLNFDEDFKGLPTDLINQLKKAVYKGDSDLLIHELNDESLMITALVKISI